MIRNENERGGSIKEIKAREKKEKEEKLHALCQSYATEKFGEEQLKQWSVKYKGIWFLPILSADESAIEKMVVMQPINRSILSYASTKIQDEGLYEFLYACMNECFVAGDRDVLDDDEYFIPASMKFNKMLEGKKAELVKR